MSTQRKIASLLGVAPSTVSRALRGDGRISPAMRAKVLEAANQLQYKPARRGREPERASAHRPNFLVTFTCLLTRSFFAESVLGIVDAARERECDITVKADVGERFSPAEAARLLIAEKCDGLILAAFAHVSDEDIRALKATGKPFVLINRHAHGACDAVTLDDYSAGFEAVRYLYGLGHRRIAHIHGELSRTSCRERLAGFRAGAEYFGVYRPELVRSGVWTSSQSHEARTSICTLLDLPEPPTAIWAHSDHVAAAVLQELHRRSLKVPDDVAVLGIDDRQFAAELDLSSFAFRQYDMGVAALHLLVDLMLGRARSPVRVCIYPELVVRGSTEPRQPAPLKG